MAAESWPFVILSISFPVSTVCELQWQNFLYFLSSFLLSQYSLILCLTVACYSSYKTFVVLHFVSLSTSLTSAIFLVDISRFLYFSSKIPLLLGSEALLLSTLKNFFCIYFTYRKKYLYICLSIFSLSMSSGFLLFTTSFPILSVIPSSHSSAPLV